MCDFNAEKLYSAILSLNNRGECESLFSDLFTKREIKDLSSRLEVARLLSEGVNYNEIARLTGASTATISRVSKCLTGEAGGYRLVLPRIYGSSPTLSLLVSAEPEYVLAYEELKGVWTELPSLTREVCGSSVGGGISVALADPRDAAAIFIGGGADLFLGSTVELMEERARFTEIKRLQGFDSLVLSGSDSPVRVASAYPSLTRELLSDRGITATVTRVRREALGRALGFDGTVTLVIGDNPADGALISLPRILAAREDLPEELLEYLTAILG